MSVDVTNKGEREADEVVQLYIHQRYGSASRPVRELKGFPADQPRGGGVSRAAVHAWARRAELLERGSAGLGAGRINLRHLGWR